MKIYFAGSIRGGRGDQEFYASIITELGKYGTVLTEHIGLKTLTAYGEMDPPDTYIFERDMKWLRESDIIVAEVTTPSLGVGYEIGQAESLGKAVLCLVRPMEGRRLSAMLTGNKYMKIIEYKNLEDIAETLKQYFDTMKA